MSISKWSKLKKGVAHAGTPNDEVFLRPGIFFCPWCNHSGIKKPYKTLWKMYLHACTHTQKSSLDGDNFE